MHVEIFSWTPTSLHHVQLAMTLNMNETRLLHTKPIFSGAGSLGPLMIVLRASPGSAPPRKRSECSAVFLGLLGWPDMSEVTQEPAALFSETPAPA